MYFDNVRNEIKIEQNPNWPNIPDHCYKTHYIGGSGSGKTILC